LTITGPAAAVDAARDALAALWDRLRASLPVGAAEVDAALRMALAPPPVTVASDAGRAGRSAAAPAGRPDLAVVKTRRRAITPRSP
ncbi:hypothetical protein ACJEM9_24720, partial [Escherichia coli]